MCKTGAGQIINFHMSANIFLEDFGLWAHKSDTELYEAIIGYVDLSNKWFSDQAFSELDSVNCDHPEEGEFIYMIWYDMYIYIYIHLHGTGLSFVI